MRGSTGGLVVRAAILVLALLSFAWAEEPAEDPAHAELRALRTACVESIDKQDLDGLLSQLHADVVVAWPTGEVSRGRDGVRAFYDKLLTGPDRTLDAYSTEVEVDDLAILHGDTAIAWGTALDSYTLRDGSVTQMTARWTASVIRGQDGWRITSFSGSIDPFDNPVLEGAKRWALLIAVCGLVAGLIVGFLLGRRRAG